MNVSGDVWAGIGCLVLGGATLVNWWFEMFSDSGYGELCRDLMEEFGGGRNTIAVVGPAAGVMFLFGGGALVVDNSSPLMWLFAPGVLLSIVVFLLGLIPLELPRLMYPEGQMERRRRRKGMTDADAAEEVWRRAGSPSKDSGDPPGDDLPARSHRAEDREGE